MGGARPQPPRFRCSDVFGVSHLCSEPGVCFRGVGRTSPAAVGCGRSTGAVPPGVGTPPFSPLPTPPPPGGGCRSARPAPPRHRIRDGHPQKSLPPPPSPSRPPCRRRGMLRGRCGPAPRRWPRGPLRSPSRERPTPHRRRGHSPPLPPPPPPVPAPPLGPGGLLGAAGGGSPGPGPRRPERGRHPPPRVRPGAAGSVPPPPLFPLPPAKAVGCIPLPEAACRELPAAPQKPPAGPYAHQIRS